MKTALRTTGNVANRIVSMTFEHSNLRSPKPQAVRIDRRLAANGAGRPAIERLIEVPVHRLKIAPETPLRNRTTAVTDSAPPEPPPEPASLRHPEQPSRILP